MKFGNLSVIIIFLTGLVLIGYRYYQYRMNKILITWYDTHYTSIVDMYKIDSIKDHPEFCVLSVEYDTIASRKYRNFIVHKSFKKLPHKLQTIVAKSVANNYCEPLYANMRFHTSC